MNWCLYLKDNKIVSDIFECNGAMLVNGSSFTVQVSDDRSVLEKTVSMFRLSRKKLTSEEIENAKKKPAIDIENIKRKLTPEDVGQIMSYKKSGDDLLIQQLLREKTGESICCQGVIDYVVNELIYS